MRYLEGIPKHAGVWLYKILLLYGQSIIDEFKQYNYLQFDSFGLSPQRMQSRIV